MNYSQQAEAIVEIKASADTLFQYLDDQASLGAHMEKPSMMMMGGKMSYEFDENRGRAIGSVIKMGGDVLGMKLSVEEVITERTPSLRKAWETRGDPDLLVIGAYRMGFEIAPAEQRSRLRVFIGYDYPRSLTGRVLGALFGGVYARWCVNRMAKDALAHFG